MHDIPLVVRWCGYLWWKCTILLHESYFVLLELLSAVQSRIRCFREKLLFPVKEKKIQILGTKPFVKITTQSIPSSRLEPVEEITLKPNIFYQSWFMLLFLAIDKLSRELHVDRVTYWQIVANNQRLVVILCITVVHSLAIFRKAYKSSRCSTG